MDENYECIDCHKIFIKQAHLNRHINNKKSCNIPKKIIKNIDTKIKKYDNLSLEQEANNKCYYCNILFTRRDNLKRHIEYKCESKRILIEKKEELEKISLNDKSVTILNNELLELKNQIKILNNKLNKSKSQKKNNDSYTDSDKSININYDNSKNINIIVNNNNNNCQINPFGKEDLSHLTNKDYSNYISNLLSGLLNYIEDIHFSDKMPSNRNICIPKLDSNYCVIFEKNKWNVKDKNEIFKNLIKKKILSLNKKCDELENNKIIDENIIDKYNNFTGAYYNDENGERENIKNEVEMMVFNNRDKINNYKKLLD
jgi:hypothetical protein